MAEGMKPNKNLIGKSNVRVWAPVVSFLGVEEREWIALINKRDWEDPEYVKAGDHIIGVLNRFLSAQSRMKGIEKVEVLHRQLIDLLLDLIVKYAQGKRSLNPGSRAAQVKLDLGEIEAGAKELDGIAKEVAEKIREYSGTGDTPTFSLWPNDDYRPDISRKDQWNATDRHPFFFATPGGIEGVYISLGRFLGSELVDRLKRCLYCKGLFIAPDNYKYRFCPGTKHKDEYHREVRKKSGFHAKDMAERRDPDSPKFHKKYLS